MATYVDATCSECFLPQEIELNPRYPNITCENCGHAVPMFEKREVGGIRAGLAAERRQMYIALLLFAGAGFFTFLFFTANIVDHEIDIETSAGDVISGKLVSRDDVSLTIRTAGGEEVKYTYARILEPQITQYRKDHPYLSEADAAAIVAATHIEPVMPEEGTFVTIVKVLALLSALAAVAFSFIASQDKVAVDF